MHHNSTSACTDSPTFVRPSMLSITPSIEGNMLVNCSSGNDRIQRHSPTSAATTAARSLPLRGCMDDRVPLPDTIVTTTRLRGNGDKNDLKLQITSEGSATPKDKLCQADHRPLIPARNASDKQQQQQQQQQQRKARRTKPRRQSGILCRRGRNDGPDTVRNLMVLTRTNSDRQILRNTLERKLRNTRRVAPQPVPTEAPALDSSAEEVLEN